MDTYFAAPERLDPDQIHENITFISQSPVVSGLLNVAGGILAVLNECRQILLFNDSFLQLLGIDDPHSVFGLRPGEAMQCVYAHEMAAGCGTSRFCSTCGAAIAIVASLADQKPVERKCAATIQRDGKTFDICLKVRSSPIEYQGRRFIIIFLQDITAAERWAEIERTFFHDISQLVTGLHGTSELMARQSDNDIHKLAGNINHLSSRLLREIELQKILLHEDISEYRLSPAEIYLDQVVQEIHHLFDSHPVAADKALEILETQSGKRIKTDLPLLLRVLGNMVTNAFEATDPGGRVKFWIEDLQNSFRFCVWSHRSIPEKIALRLFQRHFSTKQAYGRGVGTFSMKLFGEHLLGGKVDFTTSDAHGTTFRIRLPKSG